MHTVFEKLPPPPDPTSTTDHAIHSEKVAEHNQRVRQELGTALSAVGFSSRLREWFIERRYSYIDPPEDLHEENAPTICLIGSDGREEAGFIRPFDAIAALPESEAKNDDDLVETLFHHNPVEQIIPEAEGVFANLQLKVIPTSIKRLRELGLYFSKWKNLRPEQIFDATPLPSQNEETVRRMRIHTAADLLELVPYRIGGTILNTLSNRVNAARRITRVGTQRTRGKTVQHVDYDAGVSFFGEDGNIAIRSFKEGPIRLVQNALMRGAIKFLHRQGKESATENMPSRIPRRIQFLEGVGALGKLPQDCTERLIDLYQFFQLLYHRSQYRFYTSGNSETEFDRTEVKERRDELIALERKLVE
ncbi:hypothetical protein MRY87_12775 [bacterium]|nr:hypothetical protein [bacterium]